MTAEAPCRAVMPDGQPRRALDTRRAQEQLGSVATTPFEEEMRRIIGRYGSVRDR